MDESEIREQELHDQRMERLRAAEAEIERLRERLTEECDKHFLTRKAVRDAEARLAKVVEEFRLLLDHIVTSHEGYFGDHSAYMPHIDKEEVARGRAALAAAQPEEKRMAEPGPISHDREDGGELERAYRAMDDSERAGGDAPHRALSLAARIHVLSAACATAEAELANAKSFERSWKYRAEEAETRVAELRRQLTHANAQNHRHNLEVDALHYVWCDGGCASGVHRWCKGGPLTEEIVAMAERNTARMRTWLTNAQHRAAQPEECTCDRFSTMELAEGDMCPVCAKRVQPKEKP